MPHPPFLIPRTAVEDLHKRLGILFRDAEALQAERFHALGLYQRGLKLPENVWRSSALFF